MCPPSGSSWRRRAGTFCSAEVRQRGLQSTRRTATSMPAPAAGAANGLAVLSRASRPQPRPPMHWRRPCALIWSIWSTPISCRWQAGVDHPRACCQNMVNSCSMTCRTLLLAHTRMAQPLAWSGGSLCVAYARASMPRVPRGPRRPPRHAWHRLVRPNLAAPAAASLSAIMAAPSVAAGAAGKATSNSYNVRNTKLNVRVTDPAATSQQQRRQQQPRRS